MMTVIILILLAEHSTQYIFNDTAVFPKHKLRVNLCSVTVWRCFACVVVSAVDCGPPENPFNGNAVFTSTSYNSVVSYECKYGYLLSGELTRRCGADGKWSGTTPKCQGKCKNENLERSLR